ncbi:MAG: ChaN family lipoprotein [Pseudomonadota bacterium]
MIPTLVIFLAGCSALQERMVVDYRYETGNPATLDSLLEQLADKRVIFVGETHTRLDHHQLQLALLKALHDQGRELAVGAEWFQFPFQKPLDDFVAGRIPDAEMLALSGYYDRWRFDYRLYRPILDFARQHRIPVVALNAPAELIDAIREHGLEGLPAEFRNQAPSTYDRSNALYETRLRHVFGMHANKNGNFERFVDIQLTWDETMAEQAARYLERHPEKTLVIFAGAGHIAYGDGIPDRLERRTPLRAATVLPHMPGMKDRSIADYIVATANAEELPRSGLLGLFLDQTADGLVVKNFSESSTAQAAGLRKGDVLVAVEDQPTPHLAALKLALLDRVPGDTVTVAYRRGSARNGRATVELK